MSKYKFTFFEQMQKEAKELYKEGKKLAKKLKKEEEKKNNGRTNRDGAVK